MMEHILRPPSRSSPFGWKFAAFLFVDDLPWKLEGSACLMRFLIEQWAPFMLVFVPVFCER